MTRREVTNTCNVHRQANHLPPLSYNSRLHDAAQKHANYMARKHQMTHGEDISGQQTVGQRAHRAHYNWTSIGENVAAGQTTGSSVMNGWMHSKGHRDNILNGNFRHIGLGITTDGNGTTYWCMVLGKR